MRFASTFLSHSSADKDLVGEVAKHLGRRGVVAWLDSQELDRGPLDRALKVAVQAQATMALFLAEQSLASEWCKDELRVTLESAPGTSHLFPVYLGDPLTLVRNHELLRTRFLHPDGDRVNQLGYVCKDNPRCPDPKLVAEAIAEAAFRCVVKPDWRDVAIVVDQRGAGPRSHPPDKPTNVAELAIPALRFQADVEARLQKAALVGSDWDEAARSVEWGLSTALGSLRGEPREVRVMGDAQTSLLWAVGRHFDRTTSVELYAYGKDGMPITNKGQERLVPLTGGDPHVAQLAPGGPTLPSGLRSVLTSTIALGVGSRERYLDPAREEIDPSIPLYWVDPGAIRDSAQAMKAVADLVAAVSHLRREHQARELILFWTSAAHLACLAAANLTSHIVPAIRFMEWDHGRSVYEELGMAGG